MRLTITTALLACAGAGWLLTAPPAEAQSGVSNRTTTRVVTTTRPRARVTVQQRSYLDPGPQVPPYSRTDTDYVFLNRRPMDILGPGQTLDRRPLHAPWELGAGWRIP